MGIISQICEMKKIIMREKRGIFHNRKIAILFLKRCRYVSFTINTVVTSKIFERGLYFIRIENLIEIVQNRIHSIASISFAENFVRVFLRKGCDSNDHFEYKIKCMKQKRLCYNNINISMKWCYCNSGIRIKL